MEWANSLWNQDNSSGIPLRRPLDAHNCNQKSCTQSTDDPVDEQRSFTSKIYSLSQRPLRKGELQSNLIVFCAWQRGIRIHLWTGQLPLWRYTLLRPFTYARANYAGPVTIKIAKKSETTQRTDSTWLLSASSQLLCTQTVALISSVQMLLSANSLIRALKNFGTSLQYSPMTTLSRASAHQQRHIWMASGKQ